MLTPAVPRPRFPPSESGSLSAPDPLAKDRSRQPERQQDNYLSRAARAVWASISLHGTHQWHLNLAVSPP